MVCVRGGADSYRLAVRGLFYNLLFSHELQTHDNFPKVLKIIAVREHSGEHSGERGGPHSNKGCPKG